MTWHCECCGDVTARRLRRLESTDYRYGYCYRCHGERTWGRHEVMYRLFGEGWYEVEHG